MYSFQLLFFITLVANACAINSSIKPKIIPAPVTFKYLENDVLNIYVQLINLPPDIMHFLLHVVTDRHPPKTLPKTLDNHGLFQVKNPLNVGNVVIDIEIRNKMQEFCAVRNILNGSVSTGADGRSPFREGCLAFNDIEPCTILVDFKKKCDSTDLKCYIEDRTLICDSDSVWDVTWSQKYIYTTNSNRQPVFRHAGEKTKSRLKMKIYKFDENTQILTESIYSNKSYNLTTLAQVERYEEEKIFINETQSQITFTCKDAHSSVGLIYANGSKITIYNQSNSSWPNPKNYLEHLFCCVQTKTYNNGDVMVIERIVNQFAKPIYVPSSSPTQWTPAQPKPMCTMQTDYTLHCECVDPRTDLLNNYKWSQITTRNHKEQELWSYERNLKILTMPIYKFDNNTIIKCEEVTQDGKNHNNKPINKMFEIKIPDNGNGIPHFNTFKMDQTIPFNYSVKFNLSCSANAYIGIIYQKDEIIEKILNDKHFKSVITENNLTLTSSRVCCIYFEEAGGSLLREIKDVSLLILTQKELTNQNMDKGTTKPTIRPSDHYDQADSDNTIGKTSNLGLYIALPIVLIVIIVVSTIYCCLKKRRNTPKSEEMLQLETYGTTEKVLYAELDLKPKNDAPVPDNNESPYAEIIGVLHKNR